MHPTHLFLLSLLATPLATYATDNDSSSIGLSEVVVTVNRWEQLQREKPNRIAAITPAETNLQNPQTAADMLALSGEVFMQKSQLGGGSPMIRGFATNRLLYVVDGIRMNTAIFRSGNIQNVISIDPFTLENTEIVFGPSSVIYGSDAMGGVMNFTTQTPPTFYMHVPYARGNATARYASANQERTAHFDVSLGMARWASLTSVTMSDFGHLRQGSHGPTDYLKPYLVERQNGKDVVLDNPNPLLQSPSGYSQFNIMQKLRYRPAEWDLLYAFHFSETSDYARYDRHTRLRRGKPQFAQWDYSPQRWMLNQLTATHDSHTLLYDKMAIRAAIQRFEEGRIDRRLDRVERTTTHEKVDAYSLNVDFTKKITPTTSLYYGAEYVNNRVASHGRLTFIDTNKDTIAPSRYPQSRWESAAIYAQGLHRLGTKVNIEAGLRYNYYRLKADFSNHGLTLGFAPQQRIGKGAISGSLGVTYTPTTRWVLAASLSRGFRTPNVDDMGKLYDALDGVVTVPNPELRPEYANNVEVGITHLHGRNLRLDLSAYYTYLDNALVRRHFTFNGQDSLMYKGEMHRVMAIQNAASAYVYGVQLGLRARLPMGIQVRANINYQHGKEELDNGERSTLRHAAPLFGSAGISYRRFKLHLDLNAQFQGRRLHQDMPTDEKDKTEIYARDKDGNTWVPSWWTLNFKVRYDIMSELSVNAGLENILDKRYRPYSSGISAAGRNAIISATYIF